jgi:hypothetical protein
MSINLQQVVAKSKVSTLDGDLKDIAEQMLRDKFFPKNNSTEIDRDILEALQRKNPLDEIYSVTHSPVNGEFKNSFISHAPILIALQRLSGERKRSLVCLASALCVWLWVGIFIMSY